MRNWPGTIRTDDRSPVRVRLTVRRRLAGFVLAGVLLPALTALLIPLRETVDLTTDVLAFLLAVVAVASVGGLWPALAAAVGGSLLLNYYFTAPLHRFAVADRDDAVALAAFVAVAVAVSAAALRQRRLADAAASAALLAEADRTRAALLTAVSHDRRSPLASVKTAVSAVSADELTWTAPERAELLATADESLNRLTRLVENLLDMSRLQAGALAVHLTPMGVEEVLPAVLAEFGDAGRRIELDVPPDVPELLADPGLLERILANLLGNALRHSPPGRPPRVSAALSGSHIELRIVDSGPGVPETEWDRIFVPFQRLGDRTTGTGVGLGLGLALSRGLAEAMGGTLRPNHSPGGGLAMVLSLPSAPAASPRTPDPETIR
jgi:two-component system sensor histidine kinase KdpD